LGRGTIQWATTIAIWLPGTIPLWFVWDFASATGSQTWLHAAVLVTAFFYVAEIRWIHSKLHSDGADPKPTRRASEAAVSIDQRPDAGY
jgi:RsiW-degrading membrane proteinase PrsW (M82 family)